MNRQRDVSFKGHTSYAATLLRCPKIEAFQHPLAQRLHVSISINPIQRTSYRRLVRTALRINRCKNKNIYVHIRLWTIHRLSKIILGDSDISTISIPLIHTHHSRRLESQASELQRYKASNIQNGVFHGKHPYTSFWPHAASVYTPQLKAQNSAHKHEHERDTLHVKSPSTARGWLGAIISFRLEHKARLNRLVKDINAPRSDSPGLFFLPSHSDSPNNSNFHACYFSLPVARGTWRTAATFEGRHVPAPHFL
jgi:hypothetical protein